MIDFLVEKVLIPATILLAVILIIGLGAILYSEFAAEKFYLRKDDWACTEATQETRPVVIGKIVVPRSVDVCQQWSRT